MIPVQKLPSFSLRLWWNSCLTEMTMEMENGCVCASVSSHVCVFGWNWMNCCCCCPGLAQLYRDSDELTQPPSSEDVQLFLASRNRLYMEQVVCFGSFCICLFFILCFCTSQVIPDPLQVFLGDPLVIAGTRLLQARCLPHTQPTA